MENIVEMPRPQDCNQNTRHVEFQGSIIAPCVGEEEVSFQNTATFICWTSQPAILQLPTTELLAKCCLMVPDNNNVSGKH